VSDENRPSAPVPPEGTGQLVLYRAEDGRTQVSCRLEADSVWLTQAAIADLFQTTPQNITLHIGAIYEEGELREDATCKEYLQVRQEGARRVSRRLKHYNLSVILAVGYRVRSPRGTQFRQWATAQLEQYLVKGFAMDDERLKQAGGGDCFDELLARIRDIRSSERVFWRKVLDIYATSVDYDPERGGLAEILCRGSEQDALCGPRPHGGRSDRRARRCNQAERGPDDMDRQPAAPDRCRGR